MNFVEILSSFVTFALVIISIFLLQFLRSKISDSTWNYLKFWVEQAVLAAEQLYKFQNKSGAEKKTYVLSVLDGLGLDLDETEKNLLIEAAVSRLSASQKLD